MYVQSHAGSAFRRALVRTALVGTAVVAAVGLTATAAMAGTPVTVGSFVLAQADWAPGTEARNAWYSLKFQTDGNLVLRDPAGNLLWASGTYNRGVTDLDFSYQGYIALKNSSGATICTLGAANPAPGGVANLQTDGNFVFRNAGGAATWATGTYGGFVTGNYCFG
ncbi:hypothetical protein ACFVGM_30520 [Kitasatospora purpeofusca]|uniref:hypothetical protein n=1 Tax=Kitasatospora purpeofusca TaxID=67352 RepID=UPI0036AA1364